MINQKSFTTSSIKFGKKLDVIKNVIYTSQIKKKNNVIKDASVLPVQDSTSTRENDKYNTKSSLIFVQKKNNGKLSRIRGGPNVRIRPEWVSLNESYNNKFFKQPTIQERNTINRFFNSTEVIYEWSVNDFAMIPSEVVRNRERIKQIDDNYKNVKQYQGKTKIPFHLINGLPEIVFLGRSNAGKSSILNNLVTEFNRNSIIEVAKMSKRAGFTKTLNCFNIGNKFRLIDTPGYGYGSNSMQGTMAMNYLEKRRELRRCYILISANHGFTELDLRIIENLTTMGRPFEIIFTKMDKVRDLSQFKDMIVKSGIQDFPTLPRLIFANSVSSKHCPNRYGMEYLRYSIFESCGLI